MARKSIGYVKLAWTCERCDSENPGPRQFCNSCGAPQPPDVAFHQPAQELFLTKPDEIQAAKAGADVHCPYCEARNPAAATFCGACGGDLKDAEKRVAGQILGAHQPEKALVITCPSCGTRNPGDARECAGCGDSLAPARIAPKVEQVVKKAEAKPRKGGLPAGVLIIGAVLCLVVAGIFYALFGHTEETIGTVSAVSWTRSVPVEVLGMVEDEAWFDEVPADAEIQSCEENYRTTQDQPSVNTVEVCGTPYTVDQGSGYGEVVQDCVYEVYDDWCTYTTMGWTVFDTLTQSGDDLLPFWPSIDLASDQRMGEGEESYQVTFSGEDRSYNYSPDDEFEFSEFLPGSTWTLEVNAIGGVVAAEPAR